MHLSGIIVKEFDVSRKSIIEEVDLPIHIGPHLFQTTFQVIDIFPAYRCLIGQPWIHEAGVVTSTLHQKLKFVREGVVIIVEGEQAMLVSHLSSFSIVEDDDATVGTQFQALSIDSVQKTEDSIASLKDAHNVVQKGLSNVWGQVIEPKVNKNGFGLGFSTKIRREMLKSGPVTVKYPDVFRSAGYLDPTVPGVNAIVEDGPEQEMPNFVTHGTKVCNWTAIDIPTCIHVSN